MLLSLTPLLHFILGNNSYYQHLAVRLNGSKMIKAVFCMSHVGAIKNATFTFDLLPNMTSMNSSRLGENSDQKAVIFLHNFCTCDNPSIHKSYTSNPRVGIMEKGFDKTSTCMEDNPFNLFVLPMSTGKSCLNSITLLIRKFL